MTNANIVEVCPFVLSAYGRARLTVLKDEMAKLPQFTFPLRHFFVDGLYGREITIPAGCALVGYVHRQDCISVLSRGKLAIHDGDEVKILTAPLTMVVPRGSQKAGYALEDSVFTDFYVNPDNERDPDRLLARLACETHEQFLLGEEGQR